jgi:TnpA family transposase
VTSFRQRFVGATELPKSLTEFDVEQSFQLSNDDLEAIRKRFRTTGRLAAAIQLTVIRTTGRPLDRLTNVPRALLRSLCGALGIQETSIASLKTLYGRQSTLYEHQAWARQASGFTEIDEDALAKCALTLGRLAGTASSVDELVKQAEIWLFDQGRMLPGDRVLRDLARQAYLAIDEAALHTIREQVGVPGIEKAIKAVFSMRRGRTGGTVLEWLKGSPGKHGPSGLTEVTDKITFLKDLGVDRWTLDAIPNARLRAYGQAVVHRPPSETKRLKPETQSIEVICFLRMTLLELTDVALYIAARRVCDLVRRASTKVQGKQTRGLTHYREKQEQIRQVLHEEGPDAEQKLEALKQLVPKDDVEPRYSRAALVRQALVEDNNRVQALLNGLTGLDLQGRANVPSLKQIDVLRDLKARGVKDLPTDFDLTITDPVWHDLLRDENRVKAHAALRACALMSVRKDLRGGKLWIEHSLDYRNREGLLIPPEQWKKERGQFISALNLVMDPRKLLEVIRANLDAGLAGLAEALRTGKVEIDDQAQFRLPALVPLEGDDQVRRARDAMFNAIGECQFSDMIVEVDVHVGLTETLLGRKANSVQELLGCYGALLAHGTENDAKGVAAMVPGLEVAHVTSAMRALEAADRLRKANDRVVAFQKRFPIAEHWGKGDKASADMMSLDASKHLFNARIDPRRRTYAVGIYTHVLSTYGVIYDQPIVLNERQAGAAVEGVERYNATVEDGIRLSLLAVDTHGYTNVAMAVAKLLGFDLCPQLRNLSERRLFVPRRMEVPDTLAMATVDDISERAIIKGWDELLRLIASIRVGRVSPKFVLEKMGSAAQGDPLHKAADHLGKLLRSLYLCDFFSNEDFRREIHTLLNRGESVHQLQRAVFHGRVLPERGRRSDEMRAISGSHALLTNIVIAWNTMKMQEVVDRWKKAKTPVDDAWLRRMGPVHFGNINFRGTMSFGIDRHAATLLQRRQVELKRA